MSSWNSIYEEYTKLILHRHQGDVLSSTVIQIPNDRKVEFVYQLLKSDGYLPKVECSSTKSAAAGTMNRNLGNDLFNRQKDTEALKYYTESVAASPFDSRELALAYGNRSAALFSLRRFSSSLLDINRALALPHSESLEQKLLNRKAKCLARIGDINDATVSVLDFLSALRIDDDAVLRDMENGYMNCEFDRDGVNVNYDTKFQLPAVDFHNDLLPNASEKVKLNYDEKVGRLLVANEDIEPGEAIVIDRAYASVLLSDYHHTHCSNCYVRCEMMIPCSGCSSIMFCNDKCRKEASDSFHSAECKFIALLVSLKLNRTACLALKILLVATDQGKSLNALMTHPIYGQPFNRRGFDPNAVYDSRKYAAVHYLVDNFEKKDVQFQFYRAATAALLVHILKQSLFFDNANSEFVLDEKSDDELTNSEKFAGTLLLRYMYVIETNAHEIFEVIEREPDAPKLELTIGAGLYPLISIANHSCDPNLVRFSYKNCMVYYTLAPVASGEQLFDNYGQHFSSTTLEQRRQIHVTQYLFECKCEPCISDWPLYQQLPFENPTYLSDTVDVQQLELFSKMFNDWLTDPLNPTITNEHKFLCNYLMLMHTSIRKPWKIYLECQEALRQILTLRANYYVYYSDLIL